MSGRRFTRKHPLGTLEDAQRAEHAEMYPWQSPPPRKCRRCEQPTPHTYGRGLCARCYLHHGGV